METSDPWPTVSLYGHEDDVRTALGRALETHGYATVYSVWDMLFHKCPRERLIRIIMPYLSEYLGEYRITWDSGWQIDACLERPRVNIFTMFTRSPNTVVMKAGEIMEFWSRGRIASAPDLPVRDAKETFYVRPCPDTILRIIPRMTVGQYLDRELSSERSSPKESS